MASILYKSDKLAKHIGMGVEAARFMASNRWAEGRCGSMSINVTESMPEDYAFKMAVSPEYDMECCLSNIDSKAIFMSANHASVNEFVRMPMENASIARIIEGGSKFDIVADKAVRISTEFMIHLKAYNLFEGQPSTHKAIIHAYPMTIETAMAKLGYNADAFMKAISGISPDQVWTFKKGIEIVEISDPEYANKVAETLAGRKLAFVPKHGIFSSGIDPLAAIDKISAAEYLSGLIQ